MIFYVNADSENPIAEAIKELDSSGYHTDAEGKKYFFQAVNEKTVDQIYCDEDEEVISWTAADTTAVTPANTIGVQFHC